MTYTGASRLIDETVQTDRVAVPAITPWEIAMLVERRRLPFGREVGEWIAEALALPGVALIPIEPATAIDGVRLPGEFRADPADRFRRRRGASPEGAVADRRPEDSGVLGGRASSGRGRRGVNAGGGTYRLQRVTRQSATRPSPSERGNANNPEEEAHE